jgi:hypothetical protein
MNLCDIVLKPTPFSRSVQKILLGLVYILIPLVHHFQPGFEQPLKCVPIVFFVIQIRLIFYVNKDFIKEMTFQSYKNFDRHFKAKLNLFKLKVMDKKTKAR